MSAFHVYVESPVDRSPEGIERLAIAISKKYGLPVPDLIKRMTAGRFRVKANIDAATADTYARALEEVGARVKVEEAHPTQPSLPIAAPASAAKSGPIPAAARPPAPPVPAEPRAKAPTQPGEKPSRGGRYSVSPPPSSSRTALPGAQRAKTPSSGPPTSGPPREAHERSQLMPPSRVPSPSVPQPASVEIDPFGDLELSVPTGTGRPSPSSLPPANVARPATSSLPPATTSRPATSALPPATARPAPSSLPPATERPGSSSLPPATSLPPANASRASNPAYQSGLSAAYSQQIPVTSDLGALGDGMSLSSLDGEDAGGGDLSFDAPSPGMPASIGPPPEPEPVSPVKFAPSSNSAPVVSRTVTPAPIDMFAPPDAEEAEQIVNLAPMEARPEPKPGQTPTLGVPKTVHKAPVQGVTMGGVAVPEMPRTRIVAGVILAILIGFLPAHLIASTRESSAFKKIDEQIIATQSAADTPEMYATLDAFRDAQLERKESERRSIALTSILIWAVIAAGVGYVWFRRIPWDRIPRG